MPHAEDTSLWVAPKGQKTLSFKIPSFLLECSGKSCVASCVLLSCEGPDFPQERASSFYCRNQCTTVRVLKLFV